MNAVSSLPPIEVMRAILSLPPEGQWVALLLWDRLSQIAQDANHGDEAISKALECALRGHKGDGDGLASADSMSMSSDRDVRAYADELLDPVLASGQRLGSLEYKRGDRINGHLVSAEDFGLLERLLAHERAVIQAIESDELSRPPFSRPVRVPLMPGSNLVTKRIPTGAWSVLRRLSNPWAENFAKGWSSAREESDRWALLDDELNFRRAVLGFLSETNPECRNPEFRSPVSTRTAVRAALGFLSESDPEFRANQLWEDHPPIRKSLATQLRSLDSPIASMAELYDLARGTKPEKRTGSYEDFRLLMFGAVDTCVATFLNRRQAETHANPHLAALDLPLDTPGFLLAEGSVLLPSVRTVLPSTFYSFSRATVEERANFRLQALCGFVAYNRRPWPIISKAWLDKSR